MSYVSDKCDYEPIMNFFANLISISAVCATIFFKAKNSEVKVSDNSDLSEFLKFEIIIETKKIN